MFKRNYKENSEQSNMEFQIEEMFKRGYKPSWHSFVTPIVMLAVLSALLLLPLQCSLQITSPKSELWLLVSYRIAAAIILLLAIVFLLKYMVPYWIKMAELNDKQKDKMLRICEERYDEEREKSRILEKQFRNNSEEESKENDHRRKKEMKELENKLEEESKENDHRRNKEMKELERPLFECIPTLWEDGEDDKNERNIIRDKVNEKKIRYHIYMDKIVVPEYIVCNPTGDKDCYEIYLTDRDKKILAYVENISIAQTKNRPKNVFYISFKRED